MPNITDVNIYLSRWPFRRLPLDNTPALVAKLKQLNITQAWAGTFDALLHKDIASANARLVDECKTHGQQILVPFGCVNPMLPDWEEELRRCHEDHKMPGLRLHPNYHSYKLNDPECARLLSMAAQRNLIVQIAVIMEDERTLHPLVNVPAVDPAPLVTLLKELPKLRVVLLNSYRAQRQTLTQLADSKQVYFEIATIESVGGVANFLKSFPADRLLFGSYAPFFYPESAILKLQESTLTPDQLSQITQANAKRLLELK